MRYELRERQRADRSHQAPVTVGPHVCAHDLARKCHLDSVEQLTTVFVDFIAHAPMLEGGRKSLQQVMLAVPIPERRQGHLDMARLEGLCKEVVERWQGCRGTCRVPGKMSVPENTHTYLLAYSESQCLWHERPSGDSSGGEKSPVSWPKTGQNTTRERVTYNGKGGK